MRQTTGNGYWFVAEDGGILSFGDAHFYGSTGAITLNKPIVGMAVTPTGNGYWMVASDGGIFAFNDARFYGSTGAITLVKPIVDMAATPTGEGYWLVAEDGGIFTFGNAAYKGSTGAMTLNGRIVDMLPRGGDITAPKLHSLSFSPSSVDTSAGPATITATLGLTDDLAGVHASNPDGIGADSPNVNLRSPSGQQATGCISTRVSGNPLDGVYQATISLPAYAEQGTWTVGLRLIDKAGNIAFIETDTLQHAGHLASIQVVRSG